MSVSIYKTCVGTQLMLRNSNDSTTVNKKTVAEHSKGLIATEHSKGFIVSDGQSSGLRASDDVMGKSSTYLQQHHTTGTIIISDTGSDRNNMTFAEQLEANQLYF